MTIMKTLLILATLLTFTSLARAASEEKNENENEIVSNLGKIKSSTQYVQDIIVSTNAQNNIRDLSDRHRKLCPKRIRDVIDHMKITGLCFNGIDPNSTLCDTFRDRLITCVAPVAEFNDRCLPEKSKGIGMLLVNGLLSLLNHTCTLDGDRFFEILNPCILPSEKNVKDLNILAEKAENLTTVNFQRSVGDFSLQDMCGIGNNVEKLWNE